MFDKGYFFDSRLRLRVSNQLTRLLTDVFGSVLEKSGMGEWGRKVVQQSTWIMCRVLFSFK